MEVIVIAALIALGLMALSRLLPNSALGRWRPHRWFFWVVAGVLPVKLTEDVLGEETGSGDEAVVRRIHETAPATWHHGMILVTDTAAFLGVCITALVIGALLLWCRRRREVVALVLTPALAGAVPLHGIHVLAGSPPFDTVFARRRQGAWTRAALLSDVFHRFTVGASALAPSA